MHTETKVFFTAAYSGKKLYQENYDKIVKILKDLKVDLIATEAGNYKSLLTKEDFKRYKTDRELHYQAIKKGIQWADLIIFELSHESFQVGHEATIAMEMNKPVLGLSIHEDWGKRIINRYFHGIKYSPFFLKDEITNFINRYSKEDLSERFNLFLSKRQLKKLEKLAGKEDMNKSEYLRELLEKN